MAPRKLSNAELERKTLEAFKTAEKDPVVIVLDNVRSLNNIGSVFRTSDAFLVQAIYLCGFTACPPHRDINKTALGATDSVEWHYFKETNRAIDKLRSENYRIISLEQTSESIPLTDFKADRSIKYALVFGNEVKGVDQQVIDLSDQCVEIPQFGTKHSFNIAVSAGIVLWHLFISKSR